jgi:hypothetical protein
MEDGVDYGPGRNGEELGDDAEIETQLSAQHGRGRRKKEPPSPAARSVKQGGVKVQKMVGRSH